MRAIKFMAAVIAVVCTGPVLAQVFVQESFESRVAGTKIGDFGAGWNSTTGFFTVGDQAGLAASGNRYLDAPSRFGAGDLRRFAWFDASAAFNTRNPGNDVIVETVKMFIPDVKSSTYGGMIMYDQLGNPVAVIGVDMLLGTTLTDATSGVNNIAVRIGQYNDIGLFANYDTGFVTYRFNGADIGSSFMTAASRAAGFGDFDFYNNGSDAKVSVGFRYDDYSVMAVPEPATVSLFGLGLATLAALRRRRRGYSDAGRR